MGAAKRDPNLGTGRDRLLRAAEALFADRPYSEVGVAEILKTSGVQAPTLYHHFGDKEGMFVAWAESAFRRLGEELRIASANESDPIEALVSFARGFGEFRGIDLLQTMRTSAGLSRRESTSRIERAYFEAVYEPLCLLLMAAADSGRLAIDDLAKAAASFLFGAMAASPRYSLPASGADSNYRWWTSHYAYGFVRPIP